MLEQLGAREHAARVEHQIAQQPVLGLGDVDHRSAARVLVELVRHLERHGYVERVPDPEDRRAKLVRTTAAGRQVFAVVREFVVETEARLIEVLGDTRMRRLREDLETVRRVGASEV